MQLLARAGFLRAEDKGQGALLERIGSGKRFEAENKGYCKRLPQCAPQSCLFMARFFKKQNNALYLLVGLKKKKTGGNYLLAIPESPMLWNI